VFVISFVEKHKALKYLNSWFINALANEPGFAWGIYFLNQTLEELSTQKIKRKI
jgi:hypothetical protein